MAEVSLRLLGGFGVHVDGVEVGEGSWRLRKARTLVKLLALQPTRRLHREQAMELLWPDRDAVDAQNNLHQALHAARRVLAAARLTLTDGMVALTPDLDTDIDLFTRAAAVARATCAPEAYAEALELYGGELLPEDRYESWTDARRSALADLHSVLCLELAESRPAQEAVETLQRALAADPLHEPAHRALVRAYDRLGRCQDALAVPSPSLGPASGARSIDGVGRALRLPGPRGGSGVRRLRPGGDRGALRAARRHAARPRARRGACAVACADADRRPARRQPRRPLQRTANGVDAPADPRRDDRLESRPAHGGGARALPAARGLRRLVHPRRGRGRLLGRGARALPHGRAAHAARRQVAGGGRGRGCGALSAARHRPPVRGRAPERSGRARSGRGAPPRLGADAGGGGRTARAARARPRQPPRGARLRPSPRSSGRPPAGRECLAVLARPQLLRRGRPQAACGARRGSRGDGAAGYDVARGRRARAPLRRADVLRRPRPRGRDARARHAGVVRRERRASHGPAL